MTRDQRHLACHLISALEAAEQAPGRSSDPMMALLTSDPGMIERLQAGHVDDGTGHCAVCTAGAAAPRPLWPCTLRALADRAELLRTADPRTADPRWTGSRPGTPAQLSPLVSSLNLPRPRPAAS